MSAPKIAVVGSLNVDYTTRVRRFPHPGETVAARDLKVSFGGKGANQAVAARARGAEVAMVGCLGDDEMGRSYIGRLGECGIDTTGVALLHGRSTGSAFINVDEDGENTIVIASGANGLLDTSGVERAAGAIAAAEVLLLQNEVPEEANRRAVEIAITGGTTVIYNPAPWDSQRQADLIPGGVMVLNEAEAAALLGSEEMAGAELPEGVVVTRGAGSTLAQLGGRTVEVATFPVQPVDTVGAGDAFVAAYGVAAAAGGEPEEILRFANAAAALATLGEGAQGAMPTLPEIEALLAPGG